MEISTGEPPDRLRSEPADRPVPVGSSVVNSRTTKTPTGESPWALDGNPDTRVTGHPSPVTWCQGIFFIFFIFLVVNFFLKKTFEKNEKKLCFLSVFPLFPFLFLSFSVHTDWVLFSLISLTKISCEG